MPVSIPDGVTVDRVGDEIRVKGPKGTLSERIPSVISTQIEGSEVIFTRPDDRKEFRAYHARPQGSK